MQFLKIVLVTLVFILNLVIAQPSWSAKNFTKGGDYTEGTQELNNLLQLQNTPEEAGYKPEQLQQRVLQLQYIGAPYTVIGCGMVCLLESIWFTRQLPILTKWIKLKTTSSSQLLNSTT